MPVFVLPTHRPWMSLLHALSSESWNLSGRMISFSLQGVLPLVSRTSRTTCGLRQLQNYVVISA